MSFSQTSPQRLQKPLYIAFLYGRLEDLDLYKQKMSGELIEKRMEIKKSVEKLGAFVQRRTLV